MTEIVFHVEGGISNSQSGDMRRAFRTFFAELDRVAKAGGSRIEFVMQGSRLSAYKRFCNALRDEPEKYHVLLVDSEDLMQHRGECWQHVWERPADSWVRPEGVEERQCQLMAQAIEAWFFADPDKLQEYYNGKFQRSSLPSRQDVEAIPKSEHIPSLEAATKQTQKGRYHKTNHLPDILSMVRPAKVRERAWHCDQIFVTLAEKLGAKLPPLCSLAPEP